MYSRWTLVSTSVRIVRNLRKVNGRMPSPSRSWRKKTGPGDSRLDAPGGVGEERGGEDEADRRADDVDAALDGRESRGSASRSGARGEAGPRAACILTCGPTASKRRGTMSTWTSRALSERTSSTSSSCESRLRRRRRRGRRSGRRTSPGRSSGRAEHRHVAQLATALPRLGVDEADEVDPVLAVRSGACGRRAGRRPPRRRRPCSGGRPDCGGRARGPRPAPA